MIRTPLAMLASACTLLVLVGAGRELSPVDGEQSTGSNVTSEVTSVQSRPASGTPAMRTSVDWVRSNGPASPAVASVDTVP